MDSAHAQIQGIGRGLSLKTKNADLATTYLSFARSLFKDLMLYREDSKRGPADLHNPGAASPIGWGWLPTATKETGCIARGGQLYLHAETESQ